MCMSTSTGDNSWWNSKHAKLWMTFADPGMGTTNIFNELLGGPWSEKAKKQDKKAKEERDRIMAGWAAAQKPGSTRAATDTSTLSTSQPTVFGRGVKQAEYKPLTTTTTSQTQGKSLLGGVDARD